ncbi:MAG: sulfatase-like hydrolase/transferase [Acidobacteria bacterium]|nr:sulfatase-like hydrolase/transferase [Acidobacteriota bacterium]
MAAIGLPPQRRRPSLAAAVIVVVGALGATSLWWWPERASQTAQGLVLVVSIDTLRADRLASYGYAEGRTPALEALAKDAVVFERAYAHAPQTLPSHASMLTGRLPFEHGVRDNLGFTLAPDTTTLASLFRTAGFPTGGFVSSFVLRADTGIGRGFDVYDAEFPASASDRSLGQVQRPGLQTLAAADHWMQSLTTDHALVFLHIYEPHKPYAPPEPYRDLASPYDGEVALSDAIVGRLVASLKSQGWYDRATIVITADHGEGLGDHGEEEHGLFLYDESVRVPLFIKLPNQTNGGTRRQEPVQHIDLLPTLSSLAGVTQPRGLRGRDLSPLLTGTGTIAPQGIYAEALYARYHFGWSELVSLTDDRYRFVQAPREELYDLDRDPRESHNIAADRAQVTLAMRSGLATLTADRPIDSPADVSDADRQRLAALGYVGTQQQTPLANRSALPDPKDKAHILELYRHAVDHLSARRYVEGARDLRTILDDEPEMTDVWSQYATTLVRLGRFTEAFAAWRAVVQRKPEEPSGLLGAAAVLVELRRFDDARSYAELAITRAPAAAHQALANIALTQGDHSAALEQAALAERADPTLPLIAMVEGILRYNREEYADALPFLMAARERFAQRPIQASDLNYFIGDTLARLGRYDEAEPFLREEIRLYPNNTRPRVGLAMLYASTDRVPEAEQAINDLLQVAPSPDTYKTAEDLFTMFGLESQAAAVRQAARSRFGR